jgi:DNA polymerase III subunit alpha
MAVDFIHLRVHTEYSLQEGIVRITQLIAGCVERHMPAVAVTDLHNVFALVKFVKAAQSKGIKPILGADLLLSSGKKTDPHFQFTLLCQNEEGYHNLLAIISDSYLTGQENGVPLVNRDFLIRHSAGLIALSGGIAGEVGQALLQAQEELLKQALYFWQTHFPDRFYLEVQRLGRAQDESYIQKILPIAQKQRLPLLATNAVCFMDESDFEAHEARVCIHQGEMLGDRKRLRRHEPSQYFKTPKEMQALFSDLPSALKNSVEIAKRCNVHLNLGQVFLPNFPVPKEQTVEDFLIEKSRFGLEERLKMLQELEPERNWKTLVPIYESRLEIELSVINAMGFPGYFLIVADFIAWAKEHEIAVGPGRGSGAGSLVAYVLHITDLDPIKYHLLFERFLNPDRVSMPDFDVDFCMENRDRVIEYVAQRYGRENVSQIITYGTMAAKAVVRDVGRVLGFPYGFVDKIAKLIPFELGITLSKALSEQGELSQRYQESDEVRQLIDLALKLEGITRNAGKHAGGVVIAPSALTDFAAIYCEPGGQHPVTQFDKDDVEAVGLVKFDFLGLRTLTIIDWTVKRINKLRQKTGDAPLDILRIPLDDEKTFALLQACQTTAVFQLESRGMTDLVRRLKPSCFEDIIDLGALFRPGPLQSGMVDDFVNRKHGREPITYAHPDLESILKVTNGVILYQEQVMQIAQVLAGYTLGGADLLRRAMGKKKPEEMAMQRSIFLAGSEKHGVEGKVANAIFDLMEKFSAYGFNKSHSAAYALLSYQTAWLKAHFPATFMASVLSSELDNTDKLVRFVEECKQMQLKIAPPNVNTSFYRFIDNSSDEISYGLGAIKGVGESSVEAIIEERAKGLFTSLMDFAKRVDLRRVNRRVFEALIKAGAFDAFNVSRAVMFASLDRIIKSAEQKSLATNSGQGDLFSDFDISQTDQAVQDNLLLVDALNWSDEIRLKGEKEALGFYLSGHPFDTFRKELSRFLTSSLYPLDVRENQTVILAGIVLAIRTMLTKRGDRMAFMTLQDSTGQVEVAVFSDLYKVVASQLVKDQLLIIEGMVSVDNYSGGYRVSCQRVYDLMQARSVYSKGLFVTIEESLSVAQLKESLQPFLGGTCPVTLIYQKPEGNLTLALPNEWHIKPDSALLDLLSILPGVLSVEFA